MDCPFSVIVITNCTSCVKLAKILVDEYLYPVICSDSNNRMTFFRSTVEYETSSTDKYVLLCYFVKLLPLVLLSICQESRWGRGRLRGKHERERVRIDGLRLRILFIFDTSRGRNINNRPICSTDTPFVFLLVESDSERWRWRTRTILTRRNLLLFE